ncbi:hypothetical protein CHS0354_021573 [Potamilus streckersoni]|uniref:VWFC domain-containing protein n=1 Tax=Potamilus streckersoni TaxID=2493646 RepID=A0AAE0T6N1_9BIVA|nr:hypothetical protein CHS0354_021573 [Potamilus streckersoni]
MTMWNILLVTILTLCVNRLPRNSEAEYSKRCEPSCIQGGKTYCWPIHCPRPACKDPVTTPGECCPHCPENMDNHSGILVRNCTKTCKQGNRTHCWPVPCPLPPCKKPVLTPGECCPHCPNKTCPHPPACKVGNVSFCNPPPCPVPPCKHPVTIPGQCCPHCSNKTCPHRCKVGNETFCYPPPCPPPPCTNPFTVPGECCQQCPQIKRSELKRSDCPQPCNYNGQMFCAPLPCPIPPCDNPITNPGDCCPHCSGDQTVTPTQDPVTICPMPCMQGGHKYCFPLPCPHPPCVDAVRATGECCPHCPNGPNCSYQNVTLVVSESRMIGGMECTCKRWNQVECIYV